MAISFLTLGVVVTKCNYFDSKKLYLVILLSCASLILDVFKKCVYVYWLLVFFNLWISFDYNFIGAFMFSLFNTKSVYCENFPHLVFCLSYVMFWA